MGWGLRFQRLKFRVMGVVAVGTEQIGSFALGEIPTPFSMDAGFPVVVDIAMAFPTEAVTLFVTDEFPII